MTPAEARRHAERAAVAVLLRMRENAVSRGRFEITIDDIDHVVETLAAERIAAIDAESRLLSDGNCRRTAPIVPEIDDRCAGVVTDSEGRIIGEIARLVPGNERWGIRFSADAPPPVPTETHWGVRWWSDIAGVLAADDPAEVRRLYAAAIGGEQEDESNA
jgi:hypothetical protein